MVTHEAGGDSAGNGRRLPAAVALSMTVLLASGVTVTAPAHGSQLVAEPTNGSPAVAPDQPADHAQVDERPVGRGERVNVRGQPSPGTEVDARDAFGRLPLRPAVGRNHRPRVAGVFRPRRVVRTQASEVGSPEVTVVATRAVHRPARWGGGGMELAYVAVTLTGPFFERGRVEPLTVRLVPTGAGFLFDRYLENPPEALWRFGATDGYARAELELYRGDTLLGSVSGWRAMTASWLEIAAVTVSPRSGLLELHVLLGNSGVRPSTTAVARYGPATGQMNVSYHATVDGREDGDLVTCAGGERRWLAERFFGPRIRST